MEIKFKESGEGPGIGVFKSGDVREDISDSIAKMLIKRGLAEEVKPLKSNKDKDGGE